MRQRAVRVRRVVVFPAGVLLVVALAVMPMSSCQSAPPAGSPGAAAGGGVSTEGAGPPYAVAYSGYRAGQRPGGEGEAVYPSDEEILEDLKLLTRNNTFGLIRLYDSGEHARRVLRLIREHRIPLRVMLGAWLSAEVSNHRDCPWMNEPIPEQVLARNREENRAEVRRAIELANEYRDIVIAVSVGNEALVSWTDHKVPLKSVLEYVREVKGNVTQRVTVADNFAWWVEHGEPLARELDFITVHSYPFWAGRDIEDALAFTAGNIEAVRKALPMAQLMIGEVGWPTTSSEYPGLASEENQRRYFREVMAWARKLGVTVFWFEAFDEDWKGDPNNPNGAEKHFGLFTIDRKPKLVMREFYADME